MKMNCFIVVFAFSLCITHIECKLISVHCVSEELFPLLMKNYLKI